MVWYAMCFFIAGGPFDLLRDNLSVELNDRVDELNERISEIDRKLKPSNYAPSFVSKLSSTSTAVVKVHNSSCQSYILDFKVLLIFLFY